MIGIRLKQLANPCHSKVPGKLGVDTMLVGGRLRFRDGLGRFKTLAAGKYTPLDSQWGVRY